MEHKTCVKCGKPKEPVEECPYCGVYYHKAEAALAKKEAEKQELLARQHEEQKERQEKEQEVSQEATPSETPTERWEKLPESDKQAARKVGTWIAAAFIVFIFFAWVSSDNEKTTPKKANTTSYKTSPSYSKSTTPAYTGYADGVIAILNTSYGNVCHAELKGFFNKTLKIDWTRSTVKLHAMKVLAEIGSVKEQLYNDGVRYLQIPNDIGTYNVFDWKTGKKETISDRAVYYFSQ